MSLTLKLSAWQADLPKQHHLSVPYLHRGGPNWQYVYCSDLDRLSAWEGRWNMNIHPEKCQVLWVFRSSLHGRADGTWTFTLKSAKSSEYADPLCMGGQMEHEHSPWKVPSPLSMQILSAWEGRWNINIHPEKCQVLWVNRSRKKLEKSTCTTLCASVDTFKYFMSHNSEQSLLPMAMLCLLLCSKAICSLLTSIIQSFKIVPIKNWP